MNEVDGVIKFRLNHKTAPLPPGSNTIAIQRLFRLCREHDMIGRDPERYGGAAFGNISQRFGSGFLITGTQTGGQASLSNLDVSWVSRWDVDGNHVSSSGPAKPSSESLSHGQIYTELPHITFILHIHHPDIWQQAASLGLPVTDPSAAYGTPEMAAEVKELLHEPATLQAGAFSMGGHEDGIMLFGTTPDVVGQRALQLLSRCEKSTAKNLD